MIACQPAPPPPDDASRIRGAFGDQAANDYQAARTPHAAPSPPPLDTPPWPASTPATATPPASPIDERQAHAQECAQTFPARFARLQELFASFHDLKAKVMEKCAALGKHCTRFSSGRSACTGLTGEEQRMFDRTCAPWPNYVLVVEDDERCADVDPEALSMNFAWSDADAASFRKRKLPAR